MSYYYVPTLYTSASGSAIAYGLGASATTLTNTTVNSALSISSATAYFGTAAAFSTSSVYIG